ncbi:oxidoreductase [Staphylococcus simulans]|uniref:oxidoreductase n=1 Tax=Staphylococcus simulans TaxID=1286 RepID=UPI000D032403|nr:oxidoreductase [Staphylococcus simulans]PTJ33774.1 oxidoreductase [Staphylococcus simulans]RIN55286.1 oxidoreductase [Staphylococcus simulans]RIN72265.1 oxidoreductase [Staphylococcus simulans]
MQIAVIGPGAVGTIIAYELQTSLPNVTLIGRFNKQITIHPANQKVDVSNIDDVTSTFDVIIIAVKTYQLNHLIPKLHRLAHEETLFISAQNGYGLLPSLPFQHTYQAVVYISGQKSGNEVVHFHDYRLHVQKDSQTLRLKQLLDYSKIELVLEEHIEEKIWYKLLVNLGINSITALGHNTAQILKIKEVEQLCRSLLYEGQQVALLEGIMFPDSLIDDIMQIYARYPDHMGTSMYYDVINSQPLEVEAIQGFIYRKARYYNLNTPYLNTVYALLLSHHSIAK